MDASLIAEFERCVGFDEADAANLKSLADDLGPHLPAIVEEFYQILTRQPRAAAVLDAGETRLEKLRAFMLDWLKGLFCGDYGRSYWEARLNIGRTHVRVGTPQDFMVTMMEVVRQGLHRAIQRAGVTDAEAKTGSVHKLLALELAVMLETYKSSYTAKVQEHERSAVEEKLTRAEHLAEIGQLAASLAHEIKNPLAGISGAIQVIGDGLAPEHRHRAIIGEILRQINRLDAVVKDLLVYARPTAPSLAACDIDLVIRRVLTVMREEPSFEHVHLEYKGDEGIKPIQADDQRIEQLLMNLLLNAAQASPKDGVVRLETEADTNWVTLTVRDSGQGIEESALSRAFEPFFTTKAKGTGLGLPICRWIVEAHDGTIRLHSVVGKGTEVVVTLPMNPGKNPKES